METGEKLSTAYLFTPPSLAPYFIRSIAGTVPTFCNLVGGWDGRGPEEGAGRVHADGLPES
jgi:hypothetical protein